MNNRGLGISDPVFLNQNGDSGALVDRLIVCLSQSVLKRLSAQEFGGSRGNVQSVPSFNRRWELGNARERQTLNLRSVGRGL